MLGIQAFLEILAASGVRYIFGNPGSTELPLNDALVRDSRFSYIFGLHELPLTAMADGYGRRPPPMSWPGSRAFWCRVRPAASGSGKPPCCSC